MAFNTTFGYRFLISFQQYCLEGSDDIIQIGDGINYEEETRLSRFSGRTTPSDVMTISNFVWINIQYPSTGHLRFFLMKIVSLTAKGI